LLKAKESYSFAGFNQKREMAVTRLERKGRKNIAVAKRRRSVIKHLSTKPVIKNVDIEAIKAEFAANKSKASKPSAKEEKVVKEGKEITTLETKVDKKADDAPKGKVTKNENKEVKQVVETKEAKPKAAAKAKPKTTTKKSVKPSAKKKEE